MPRAGHRIRRKKQTDRSSYLLSDTRKCDFCRIVLSQILDYDYERQELQKRLEEIRAIRTSRGYPFSYIPSEKRTKGGPKSAPTSRKYGGNDTSDGSVPPTTEPVSDRPTSSNVRSYSVFAMLMRRRASAARPPSESTRNTSGEEAEPASQPEETSEVDFPIAKKLMSSHAVQVLSDMNPVPREKTTFKTAATNLTVDIIASKVFRTSGNNSPVSGRKSPKSPDSGAKTGILQLRKENRPTSPRRPRSGVKPELKKSTSETPLVSVGEKSSKDIHRSKTEPAIKNLVSITRTRTVTKKKQVPRIHLKEDGRGIMIKYEDVWVTEEEEVELTNNIENEDKQNDDEIDFTATEQKGHDEKRDETERENKLLKEGDSVTSNRSLPNLQVKNVDKSTVKEGGARPRSSTLPKATGNK